MLLLFAFAMGNLWSQISLLFELESDGDTKVSWLNTCLAVTGMLLLALAVTIDIAIMPLIWRGGQDGFLYRIVYTAGATTVVFMAVLAIFGLLCIKKGRTSDFHKNMMFLLCIAVLISAGSLAVFTAYELGDRSQQKFDKNFNSDCKANDDSSLQCARNFTKTSRR